ncbi:MAG: putative peptidoglycan glycosyltransferase FtsW [Armatimonadota bacterium]|nr:putative peptidoglycan glycosyltransferase FtsW [Armatimonadota bacterium]
MSEAQRNATAGSPDKVLFGIVLALVVCGVLLVFDASYPTSSDQARYGNDAWYFAKRQMAYAAVGVTLMLVVSLAPLEWIRKASIVLLLVSIGLLVHVLRCGVTINGSKSWEKLGPVLFQPSELAKLAIIVYLARALGRPGIFAKGRERRWLVPLAWSGLTVLLVVAERDFGTAAVMTAIVFVMFALAGAKKRYLALAVVIGAAAVLGAMTHLPHCRARVAAYKDPWQHYHHAGYQIVHSLIGFGTGGLTGVGLGEGRVKSYIPAAYTDYIYATLAEEFGLVGSLALVILFAALAAKTFIIAGKSKSLYGALLAAGVGSAVSTQALINMAVATNSIPATGLPLPLISYGGSSLVTTLLALGLVLSVSRNVGVEIDSEKADENSAYRRRDGRARISGRSYRGSSTRNRSERRITVRR